MQISIERPRAGVMHAVSELPYLVAALPHGFGLELFLKGRCVPGDVVPVWYRPLSDKEVHAPAKSPVLDALENLAKSVRLPGSS